MRVKPGIHYADSLFEQVKTANYENQGESGLVDFSLIARGKLMFPLRSYEIIVGGDERQYYIQGEILRNQNGLAKSLTQLKRQLKTHLNKSCSKFGLEIEDSGAELRLLQSEVHRYSIVLERDAIIVDAGKDYGLLSDVESFGEFSNDLDCYVNIFSNTLSGIYNSSEKNPNLTITVKPPFLKKQVSNKSGSNKKKLESSSDEELHKTVVKTKPKVLYSDIAGGEDVTEAIQDLEIALKSPELYTEWGTVPPRGVLLYGEPGTGKSMRAKALAAATDATFYHVKSSDIVSKWLGETESNMKDLFEAAKKSAPSIIFIDEMDQLGRRDEGTHQAIQRAVSVLLEELDGFESNEGVLLVGATNRPEYIDKALLSRMSCQIEVPMPSTEDRVKIFKVHAKLAGNSVKKKLVSSLDYQLLAQITDNFSGRDIAEVLRKTLEEKAKAQYKTGQVQPAVSTQELVDTVKLMKTRKKYANGASNLYS